MCWDIFCKVIDNFGDIGVCWRLSADLASRGHTVRLWVDDHSALAWMAPGANEGRWPNVEIVDWRMSVNPNFVQRLAPATVWVEGFGCEIAPEFIAASAESIRANGQLGMKSPAWINLEYLSAEAYVERCHALPSPVMQGPAQGWTKHFYYPGFSSRTGGLLREADYLDRQAAFDATARTNWLTEHGVTDWSGERLISLFCYEPPALPRWLESLAQAPQSTRLLVTPGRAQAAVQQAWTALGWPEGPSHGALRCHFLTPMTQKQFDELLWSCDLNCVRGEDSLVRAIWAGKPWLWHIYPQDDGAHGPKLDALLDRMEAPASLRGAQLAWNGLGPSNAIDSGEMPLAEWANCTGKLRSELLSSRDLTSQLIDFVQKKR